MAILIKQKEKLKDKPDYFPSVKFPNSSGQVTCLQSKTYKLKRLFWNLQASNCLRKPFIVTAQSETCCAAAKPHSKYVWVLWCNENRLLNQFGILRLLEGGAFSYAVLCADNGYFSTSLPKKKCLVLLVLLSNVEKNWYINIMCQRVKTSLCNCWLFAKLGLPNNSLNSVKLS